MLAVQVKQSAQVTKTTDADAAMAISETELEHTLAFSMMDDYNDQLQQIAQTMQSNLTEKKDIQAEITSLTKVTATDVTEIDGVKYYELTQAQSESLKAKFSDLDIQSKNGKFYVTKNSVDAEISTKQQDLSGLNSNSEMMSLQIQSLIDQRKQAIMMLSNLLSSRHETSMAIINNFKS